MAAARVREACGIPGTSVHTTYLCRDKPAMKEVLRDAGIRAPRRPALAPAYEIWAVRRTTSASRSSSSRRRAQARQGPSVSTVPTSSTRRSPAAVSTMAPRSLSRSSSRATRASTTRSPSTATWRWTSPRTTTRTCSRRCGRAGSRRSSSPPTGSTRAELRRAQARWAAPVIRALGIGTSATHMEWFAGPKGLYFSEIGCPPARACAAGTSTPPATTSTSTVEWADGRRPRPGRPAAVTALRRRHDRAAPRPRRRDQPATTASTRSRQRYGEWVIDAHLPPAGHADPAGRGRVHGQRLGAHAPPGLRRRARDARRRRANGAGPRVIQGAYGLPAVARRGSFLHDR